MRRVTKPSIAYTATQVCFPVRVLVESTLNLAQVRFSLTSAQVFSRTDLATDSERFYNSILELLDDIDEKDEVEQLLTWWNR
jgi:hypothetical protein